MGETARRVRQLEDALRDIARETGLSSTILNHPFRLADVEFRNAACISYTKTLYFSSEDTEWKVINGNTLEKLDHYSVR